MITGTKLLLLLLALGVPLLFIILVRRAAFKQLDGRGKATERGG